MTIEEAAEGYCNSRTTDHDKNIFPTFYQSFIAGADEMRNQIVELLKTKLYALDFRADEPGVEDIFKSIEKL